MAPMTKTKRGISIFYLINKCNHKKLKDIETTLRLVECKFLRDSCTLSWQ